MSCFCFFLFVSHITLWVEVKCHPKRLAVSKLQNITTQETAVFQTQKMYRIFIEIVKNTASLQLRLHSIFNNIIIVIIMIISGQKIGPIFAPSVVFLPVLFQRSLTVPSCSITVLLIFILILRRIIGLNLRCFEY
jgi:hypothetical protein